MLTCRLRCVEFVLGRLQINSPRLTSAGLPSPFEGVLKSLADHGRSIPTEARALDSLVAHTDRLESLLITPDVATNPMIERRADAFERRRVLGSHAALPVIDLTLDQTEYLHYPAHGLVELDARGKWNRPRGWWSLPEWNDYASGIDRRLDACFVEQVCSGFTLNYYIDTKAPLNII